MSLPDNVTNALYNLDRAVASAFGAPPQETISSEAGRHLSTDEGAKALCHILNTIQPGHCDHAITHADALDQVDDGQEG